LMVGNTMYQVAAGKALMGAVIAAGLPIAAGLTGLALVALAMKYVKNRQRQAKKNSNEEKFKHHVGSKYYQGPAVKEGKITKSQLAQIIQEELKATLSESYALYDDLEDWALEALVELGGEQPAGEIAAKAFEEWSLNAHHNTEVGDEDPDHSVSEEVWSDSIDAALQSLVDDGRVRLTQGGPGSTNEDLYALAQ